MKVLFLLSFMIFLIPSAFAQVTSVTFKAIPPCPMGEKVLSGDGLVPGLTPEKARAATQYNDIAKNKIRGMCGIKVLAVKSGESACKFVGDVKALNFDAKKYASEQVKNCSSSGCLPSVVILCMGKVFCKDHPEFKTETYTVTCPGSNGSCPDVESCMKDVYTTPEEDISEAVMNAKEAKAKEQ